MTHSASFPPSPPSPVEELVRLVKTASSPEIATTYALARIFNTRQSLCGERTLNHDDGTQCVFEHHWADLPPRLESALDKAVADVFDTPRGDGKDATQTADGGEGKGGGDAGSQHKAAGDREGHGADEGETATRDLCQGATLAASHAFDTLIQSQETTSSSAASKGLSPQWLNQFIAALTPEAETVFDPACGMGGTLVAAVEKDPEGAHVRVRGADINAEVAEIARMRLILAGAKDPVVEVRDSLEIQDQTQFDLVVSHPPMGLRLGKEEVSDALVHALHVQGSMVDGNAAWLSLVNAAISEDGRGFVVVPPASTSNRTQMQAARAQILAQGRLEAVIALPAGVLPKTHVAPFLWAISGKEDPRKDGNVLMVAPVTNPQEQVGEDAAAASNADTNADERAGTGEGVAADGNADATRTITDVIRAWLYDAEAPDVPQWRASLVPGEDLIAKGYAPQIHLPPPPLERTERPTPAGHLLTALRLRNFKSVGASTSLPLRPLTLLYGKNSAGKSSLIQSLLLLKQSLLAGGFTAAGQTADLGSLAGLLHRHDLAETMDVGITFASAPVIDSDAALPDPREPRTYQARFAYPQAQDTGRPQALHLGIGADTFELHSGPEQYLLSLEEFKRVTTFLEDDPARIGGSQTRAGRRGDPSSQSPKTKARDAFRSLAEGTFPYVRYRAEGMTVGGLEPEFMRDVSYRTAGSVFHAWGQRVLEESSDLFRALSDEALNLAKRMVYLGPMRRAPERFSHRRPIADGFDMPFYLLEHPSERKAVSDALARLEIPYSLDVVNPIDPIYRDTLGDIASLVLTDTRSGVQVTPADVGFGISQVLPIVTEISARSNSVIMIEQPEIHLHPAMQAELADLFIETVDPTRGANQVIAETHSEVLIMRIQKRIRERLLSPRDVLLLYIDQDTDGNAVIEELRLDENGDFLDHWPGGFFDEQFNEIFGDL